MLQSLANNPLLTTLLLIFIISVLLQLVYIWVIYSRLAFYKKSNEISRQDIPISIIICARNEHANLKKHLPLILEQDYPIFEVIVVDHRSDDDTQFLLEDLKNKYSNLSVVSLTQDLNFFKGKKFPLSIGIKSAKYDNILLTDADCVPASDQWIRRMAANINNNVEIVLGYGAYKKYKGLLNKLIRFDTLKIATNYLSFALIGFPYMGVGRNLAYKKDLFFNNKGFISHYNIPSGDDDLFVNQVANKKNTCVEIDKTSFTYSEPKKRYKEWIFQKTRHNKTGRYYKKSHLALLGVETVSAYLFWILSILLLCINYYPIIVVAAMILRLGSQLFITKKIMQKLKEKGFWFYTPLFEIILLLHNFIFWLKGSKNKPYNWK